MTRLGSIVSVSCLVVAASLAQNKTRLAVRSYRAANEHKILQEFVDLLAIPNVAADVVNIRRNAEVITRML